MENESLETLRHDLAAALGQGAATATYLHALLMAVRQTMPTVAAAMEQTLPSAVPAWKQPFQQRSRELQLYDEGIDCFRSAAGVGGTRPAA